MSSLKDESHAIYSRNIFMLRIVKFH